MEDLEDRISLANVIRSACCRGVGIRVDDLRRAKRPVVRLMGGDLRKSQAYALSVYTYAVGGIEALMKSMLRKDKEGDTQKDVDEEDEELEQKVIDKVASVGEVKLTACSQCSEQFTKGFKGVGGAWLCTACWQEQLDKESQHRWQDGWLG